MGRLSDLAKKQSKYLMLDIGESIELEFVNFTETVSNFDPEKTTILYKFMDGDGRNKFWTNGSAMVMRIMDKAEKGNKVRISRSEFKDKDGNVVQGKSSWSVEIIK